ncbi:MAG: hypothetical protein E7661_07390 [Ruminococcaceae bacterium]|nr:hypothetical protein [Oscillospiraceae bacterium]
MKKALSLILTAIILLTATLPLAACGKKEECELCGDEYPEKKMDKVRFAGDTYYVCEDCEGDYEECALCESENYEFKMERVKHEKKNYYVCGSCEGKYTACDFCKEKKFYEFQLKTTTTFGVTIHCCQECYEDLYDFNG